MSSSIKQFLSLCLLLVTGWAVYENGLEGGFLFDDEENISRLAIIDNELSLKRIKRYFAESDAGPLKRPVSVFTFLIDAQDWPADARSFKQTNLLIHLLNTALLYGLLLKIFTAHVLKPNQVILIATLGCAVWAFHPFLVSSTLYIVQRMAMLPLTFMLAGMWWYLQARQKYHSSNGRHGKYGLFASVYLMTVLAMLSKENGIVFVWLIGLFEVCIIQRYLSLKPLKRKLSLWLWQLPGVMLLILIIAQMPSFLSHYDHRTFDMGERLMSETRAICLYLYHWFVPTYFTEGVFTDGFKASTHLLKPLTTLLSTVFLIGLITLAWVKRKQWVWFSFAVFFFLLAQVLESTVIPLELYYEHRTYVSAVFLAIPLILWCIDLSEKSMAYMAIPVMIVMLLVGMTWHKSTLWSDNLNLHELTMEKYPQSVRARVATAVLYERSGKINQAIQLLNDSRKIHDNLELEFNRLALLCVTGNLVKQQAKDLMASIEQQPLIKQDLRPYINLTRVMFQFNCLGDQTLEVIYSLADAAENNPNKRLKKLPDTTHYIKAQVHFKRQEYRQSKDQYLKSFNHSKTDYQAMQSAILPFINAGQVEHAAVLLERAEQLYQTHHKYRIDWHNSQKALQGLRQLIDRLNNSN